MNCQTAEQWSYLKINRVDLIPRGLDSETSQHKSRMFAPERIADFSGKRILLVGDIMLDKYVHGKVDRISPEAPVPIHLKESESSDIGGAGTVLRNLSALGAYTIFISVVGDDRAGKEILALVEGVKNTEAYIITEKNRPTTVKTRFVCGHHQLARADEETTSGISDRTRRDIETRIETEMSTCDAVIISDYAKGIFGGKHFFTDWAANKIIARAKVNGIPVIVDPKGKDFSAYCGAYIITPNIPELNAAADKDCRTYEDIISCARGIIKLHNIENVLVTRSKDGMTLVRDDVLPHDIPSFAREVYDVTGAGDTAVATLALGIASGVELPDAAFIANIAAGIVVGKLGTATVTQEELVNAIRK